MPADPLDPADRGSSLLELSIAMVLLVSVLSGALTVSLAVQRAQGATAARDSVNARARVALASIDRLLRSGNVLYDPATESPAGFSLRAYTQSNGIQRCVQWSVADGLLKSRAWSPTWQTDGAVTGWHVLATGVTNTSAEPPFSLDPTPAYAGRLLLVSLQMASGTSGSADGVAETAIAGRNTSYGFSSAVCSAVPPT